jgi:hypothetical protein
MEAEVTVPPQHADANATGAGAASRFSSRMSAALGGRGATKTIKRVPLPNPAFREHMYVRATIVRYDQDKGTYDLKYRDGPYLGSEDPDGKLECVDILFEYYMYL